MTAGGYILLAPSEIHGVGVFVQRGFNKGEIIPVWGRGDSRTVSYPQGQLLKMCKRYCVSVGNNMWCCPKEFNRMSAGWHLNHSITPNAEINIKSQVIALRRIKKGEEITIDYKQFDNVAER